MDKGSLHITEHRLNPTGQTRVFPQGARKLLTEYSVMPDVLLTVSLGSLPLPTLQLLAAHAAKTGGEGRNRTDA
jgi:hypothetical protein